MEICSLEVDTYVNVVSAENVAKNINDYRFIDSKLSNDFFCCTNKMFVVLEEGGPDESV